MTPNAETHLDASKAVIQSAEKDAYYTLHLPLYHQLEKPRQPHRLGRHRLLPPHRQHRGPPKLQPPPRPQLPHPPRHRRHRDPVTPTDTNESFTSVPAGKFVIPRPGTWRLWLEPARMEPNQPLFNVRELLIKNP